MAKPKTAIIQPYTGFPFIVIAKKSMLRGGRAWKAGVHEFTTEEAVKELGDEETIAKMLHTLGLYPDDFEVKTAEGAELKKLAPESKE
jgi:hypothetical protein